MICLVCFARRCLPCNLFDMLCVLNFVCILCLRWFVFWIFVPYFLSAFADRLSVLLHQVVSVVAEKFSSEFSTFSAVVELLFGGFRTFRFSVWPTEFLFHRWLFAILLFFYVWFDRVSVLAERPDQPFLWDEPLWIIRVDSCRDLVIGFVSIISSITPTVWRCLRFLVIPFCQVLWIFHNWNYEKRKYLMI